MSDWLWDDESNIPLKRNKRTPLSTVTEFWAEDSNVIRTALEALRSAVRYGTLKDIGNAIAGVSETRIANKGARLWASENGERYRRLLKHPRFYDIRESVNGVPGALPGQANSTRTRLAVQAILDDISHSWDGSHDGVDAVIYTPFDPDAWWFDGNLQYTGNVGRGIVLLGEHSLGRFYQQGSCWVYDGLMSGQVGFDFRAINGSEIRNMVFNGGGKARKVVWLRNDTYENPPGTFTYQASSGVNVHSTVFVNPEAHPDSVLCAAGDESIIGSTPQSSEYRFFNCYFSGVDGIGTPGGWGFKAMTGGNTKNFVFNHCIFGNLYRGIEASSGYIHIIECNGSNIGYDRPDASMIVTGGSTTVLGGGMENGSPGFASRFLIGGFGAHCDVSGVYTAGNMPADDVVMQFGGPGFVRECDFEGNSRDATTMLEWTPDTALVVGQERFNGTKAYRVASITTGITAGAGGPTGTGIGIVDGGVVWNYVNPVDGNHQLIMASGCGAVDGSADGAVFVEGNSFAYRLGGHRNYSVPIVDGNYNDLGGKPGSDGDYPRTTRHRVYCRGNTEGEYGSRLNNPLRDIWGDFELGSVNDQMLEGLNDSGVVVDHNSAGLYRVTIPYTVFSSVLTEKAVLCAVARYCRRSRQKQP